MCVCVYIYTHASYIYIICIHMYTYTYILLECTYMYMYLYMYIYVCMYIYIHTYRIHTGPWAAAPRTHRRCQPLAIYRLHPLCTRVLVRALALSDFCGETRDIYTYNTPTHTHTHPHTQTCSRQSAIRFLRENAIVTHYI